MLNRFRTRFRTRIGKIRAIGDKLLTEGGDRITQENGGQIVV